MRDFVRFYLNGEPHTVRGEAALFQMSDYLRYVSHKVGTKVVCAEGDCGACTVMRAFVNPGAELDFQAVNSCIAPVFLFDGCQVVTVEGVEANGELHPVQRQMLKNNGGQCGFCTPGFVMAMTNMFEHRSGVDEKDVKNYLTGNLCRCTGYQDIVSAALSVVPSQVVPLRERYRSPTATQDLLEIQRQSVEIGLPGARLRIPAELDEALKAKMESSPLMVVSGATDLGVQLNKERLELVEVMSLNLIPELREIKLNHGTIEIGAKVTLAEVQRFVAKSIPELDRFLNIFASPQIKNMATLVGNIANASPIADTTPCLMVLEAQIEVASSRGKRTLPVADFFRGYKRTDLRPDELITRVLIPVPDPAGRFGFFKVSQRRDLDISAINAAFYLRKQGGRIADLRIAYGGVGPVTLQLKQTETALRGQEFKSSPIELAKKVLLAEISPISDARGSDQYRRLMALNLFDGFFRDCGLADG